MDTAYDFRAPRYVDFLNAVHDTEETDFFDYDLDTGVPLTNKSPLKDEQNVDDEPSTPYQDAESSYTTPEESPKSRRHTTIQQPTLPRRSIFDGIEVEAPQIKAHSMKTRLDRRIKTPRLELRSRSIVKDYEESPIGIEENDQDENEENDYMDIDETHHATHEQNNKQQKRKRNHSEVSHCTNEEPPAKFISMAEHILVLQKKTPARFHTKPRFDGVTKKVFGGSAVSKHITVPHTPALKSHLRTRPVHALTREEEELRDFEEAQKAKFKAAPLKENVFKPPKITVEKKPPTEVKPFKLTEYKPKERSADDAPVVFKARPVPKTVLSGPKVEVFRKKKAATPPPPPKPAAKVAIPAKIPRTEVQPFSFEGRQLGGKDKREKLLKEQEEAERKLRQFKARPLPGHKATTERLTKSAKPKPQNEEPPTSAFKARSPAVLRQAPFVPLKTPRSPLAQKPFSLNTQTRAKNRERFDLAVKERELQLEMQKRQQEEEEERRIAEEVAKWRKECVHQARAVPHFKRFEVKPSDAPLTDPHSPSFIKRLRERKSTKSDQMNSTFDIES